MGLLGAPVRAALLELVRLNGELKQGEILIAEYRMKVTEIPELTRKGAKIASEIKPDAHHGATSF